jgi:hypothetical protein
LAGANAGRRSPARDRADLLAISQVLSGLRFSDPGLLRLFGGEKAMIESPLLQKMIAERLHDTILVILKDRFGTVPREVIRLLREVIDEKKLQQLAVLAGKCPDLEEFREALSP